MKKELPNFTEGSLGYPMFRFAVPILGALILQTVLAHCKMKMSI